MEVQGSDREGATVIMGIKMMYTRPCVFHLQNIPVAEVCVHAWDSATDATQLKDSQCYVVTVLLEYLTD